MLAWCIGWFLRQSYFKPKNTRDLGKLIESRISPPILNLGQATQSDPGKFRQITLTKPEKLPPSTQELSDMVG
jgi:hypothetical protein